MSVCVGYNGRENNGFIQFLSILYFDTFKLDAIFFILKFPYFLGFFIAIASMQRQMATFQYFWIHSSRWSVCFFINAKEKFIYWSFCFIISVYFYFICFVKLCRFCGSCGCFWTCENILYISKMNHLQIFISVELWLLIESYGPIFHTIQI